MENTQNLPIHVAVIPDGNRRWAKERGMKLWEGHDEGAKNIERLAKKAFSLGVKCLSFWGSSVDNLTKRPPEEKIALLRIYEEYFQKLITSEDIVKNDTKINIIGRWREQFPEKLKSILEKGVEETKHRTGTVLNFFLAYNGDDEMIETVKKIAKKYREKEFEITAKTIKENLMTKDLPTVDLVVRTGGEAHLSAGFMMWDTANSQLHFSEKYFPDFTDEDLAGAVEEYQKRERRLGK